MNVCICVCGTYMQLCVCTHIRTPACVRVSVRACMSICPLFFSHRQSAIGIHVKRFHRNPLLWRKCPQPNPPLPNRTPRPSTVPAPPQYPFRANLHLAIRKLPPLPPPRDLTAKHVPVHEAVMHIAAASCGHAPTSRRIPPMPRPLFSSLVTHSVHTAMAPSNISCPSPCADDEVIQ